MRKRLAPVQEPRNVSQIAMGGVAGAVSVLFGCGHQFNLGNGDTMYATCPTCYMDPTAGDRQRPGKRSDLGPSPAQVDQTVYEIADAMVANVTKGEFGRAFKSVMLTDVEEPTVDVPSSVVIVARGATAEKLARAYAEITD